MRERLEQRLIELHNELSAGQNASFRAGNKES
jgi:hypothetical protein